MPIPILPDSQLETLTEVCGFGLTHAATALSQLMGKPVRTEAPRLRFVAPEGVEHLFRKQRAAGLYLQILGNLRGGIVILFSEKHARRALELLLGEAGCHGSDAAPDREDYSELEASTLKEIGNILASACLNALGAKLNMALLPSIPHLECGDAADLLSRALKEPGGGDWLLMIDTDFSIADAPCSGSMFLMPAASSLEDLLGSRPS